MTRVIGRACATILVTAMVALRVGAVNDVPVLLERGKPVERALSGGESHTYQIALGEGECAVVIAEQRGIDVSVRVSGPDGKTIADFDAESRPRGPERVEIVSDEAAIYQVTVSARYPYDPAGAYALRIDDIHRATDRDLRLDEARRLYTAMEPLRAAGKYTDAAGGFRRAVQLAEQAVGGADPYVATLLLRLGAAQRGGGDGEGAEQSFRRALEICDASLGREHPQTGNTLSIMAVLYVARDDYATAEPMLKEAIGILERALGPEHPRVATVLSDLADLHSYRGDMAHARAELERAYAIGERTLDPADFSRIALTNNLGGLYVGLAEYDLGEPLLISALEAIEQRFGADSIRVSNPLLSLGIIARERGQYSRALEYVERAYAVRERALGKEHRETASLLITIGNVHNASGDYERALGTYAKARDVLETTAGPYHSLTLLTLVGAARSYAALGDIAHAVEYQKRVDDVLEKTIDFNLSMGSARAKLAFADSVLERTGRTISLSVGAAANDRAAVDLAAQVLLQRKGRVQDATGSSLAALRDRMNEGDRRLLDQLHETTTELANLALQGPAKTAFPEYRQRLAALEELRGALEAEASERSGEFRARSQPVTLAAVQARIPPQAALVEFAVYQPFDPKAPTDAKAHGDLRYIAYVVPHSGEIRLKELGAAKDVEPAIERFREALRNPATDPGPPARALDRMVMEPVRELLDGKVSRLLISPDGALNLVPFEALVDQRQRYLVERYAVNYLTTGRDLLRLQVPRPSKTEPLIVADALFGETRSAKETTPRSPSSGRSGRRGVSSSDTLGSVYFAPLAGTGSEARAIKALFPEATVLTGAAASKAALTHAHAPRLLHVATHGFFLRPGDTIDNPLIRSGLALSGANLSADRERGILTALEASNLDLWGTKLVTLSACDTGVGEIKNGEGVYGLRRAFFLAGAETLVMSLWPVSDAVTREMMSAYYGGLKQGLGRGDALRHAQLAMQARPNRQHPFYWSSFIQAGEWANLDGRRSETSPDAAERYAF